jgi:hypothetical protein
MRLSRFTIDTHMKLLFAGATHASQSRVREQIRVTLKMPLIKLNYADLFNILVHYFLLMTWGNGRVKILHQ